MVVNTTTKTKDDARQKNGTRSRSSLDNQRTCPLCPRTFSKTEHLERHIRSHTKEKPFECEECRRRYGRYDTLLRHKKDQHRKAPYSPSGDSDNDSTIHVSQTSEPAAQSTLIPLLNVEIPTNVQNTNTIGPVTGVVENGDFGNIDLSSFLPQQDQAYSINTSVNTQDFNPPSLTFNFDAQFASWAKAQSFDYFFSDPVFFDSVAEIFPGWNEDTQIPSEPTADLRTTWYTHPKPVLEDQIASGVATPLTTQHHAEVVDDNYRQSLQRKLQIRPSNRPLDQTLPSSDFLNLCISAFFKRFHPIFPVVHAPTFRPSKTNSVLLLSICSVGSLLTGFTGSLQLGIQMWERLHKAILAKWESIMSRGPAEVLSLVQAVLIGQTFGLISGEPKHLPIVDAFHGTLISLARKVKCFGTRHKSTQNNTLLDVDADQTWREWIRTEELIRIAVGLHIHDAELANIFHHEPLLRHNGKKIPMSSSNELFNAPTPKDWKALLAKDATSQALTSPNTNMESTPEYPFSQNTFDFTRQQLNEIPLHNQFSIYQALESISATIVEYRVDEIITDDAQQQFRETLVHFQKRFLLPKAARDGEHFVNNIYILWHLTFMSLYSDFDLLEQSIGRDGPNLCSNDQNRIVEWSNSQSAKACVAHALLIKKRIEAYSLAFEPAIHVPRAAFMAAIALFSFSKFGKASGSMIEDGMFDLQFHELKAVNGKVSALFSEIYGTKSQRLIDTIRPVYELTDLLRRIGHLENARTFASILAEIVHVEAN